MNDTTMLHEGLITTKEASNLFRYTSSYLAHLLRTKQIHGRRLGRSWLIEQDSLLRFTTQRGKQDAKNTHSHVRPRSQEHKTHRVSDMAVTFSPVDPDPIPQSHRSTPASSHFLSLSPKWIAAVSVVMLLVFGAMIVQSPVFSLSLGTLQTLPQIIGGAPLALGEFVITATHTVIAADAALVYGIVAAAPATAQVTVQILISIGDILSNATARIPAQVASVFAQGAR